MRDRPGRRGADNCPSPPPGAGWALRRSAFGSAATEEEARRMVRWPFRRADAACADGGPSCGLPGCHEQAATPDRAEGFHERGPHGTRVLAPNCPAPRQRWVKIVTPPGWPRSKPQTPRAERRGFGGVAFNFLDSLGVARLRGTRVRFVFGWTRDPAFRAPSSLWDRRNQTTTPPASLTTGAPSHA
jgi:hypothetical protein